MKKSQLRKIIREVIKEQDGTAGPRPLAPSKGRKPRPTGTSRRGDGGGIKKLTGKEVTPALKKWYCVNGGYDLLGCHQEGTSTYNSWYEQNQNSYWGNLLSAPFNTEQECYVAGCHDNGMNPYSEEHQAAGAPDIEFISNQNTGNWFYGEYGGCTWGEGTIGSAWGQPNPSYEGQTWGPFDSQAECEQSYLNNNSVT